VRWKLFTNSVVQLEVEFDEDEEEPEGEPAVFQ
jgi:hypothetical protein